MTETHACEQAGKPFVLNYMHAMEHVGLPSCNMVTQRLNALCDQGLVSRLFDKTQYPRYGAVVVLADTTKVAST